jgi:fluoroquinolone resistance protein
MAQDDSGQFHKPIAASNSVQQADLAKVLTQRSDLTYRMFDGLIIVDADVYQSLFTGSIIRECEWRNIRFTRADLDGIRAENTMFEDCDFSICDFRSSQFSGCTFNRCRMNDSFVKDSNFSRCLFSDCSFDGASVSESRFSDCSLERITLLRGTWIHNRFLRCTMTEMTIGDCTFLYIIMRNSRLRRVNINADAIGAIFGLTRDQVAHVGLVFLGRAEPVPADIDLVEALAQQYIQRRWYIGELVLALNCSLVSPAGAFESYLAAAFARFAKIGFAKGDEVRFLGDILEELAASERLPLLTLLSVRHWCDSLELEYSRSETPRTVDEALRALSARASLLLSAALDSLENHLPPFESAERDSSVRLKATFRQQPSIPVFQILNTLASASTLTISQSSFLIEASAGSYIEVISTTLSSVLAFQVFLFLINGCLIQMTELKHRLKAFTRSKPPKDYAELAARPVQNASPVLLSVVRGLANYARSVSWLKDPYLSGLVPSNIENLQLESAEAKSPRKAKKQ